MTLILCLLLLLLGIGIPLIPWIELIRLFGILLLGPHMWYFGRVRRRAAAAEASFEESYQNSSAVDAMRMVEEVGN
jgi:hypothetical protein